MGLDDYLLVSNNRWTSKLLRKGVLTTPELFVDFFHDNDQEEGNSSPTFLFENVKLEFVLKQLSLYLVLLNIALYQLFSIRVE